MPHKVKKKTRKKDIHDTYREVLQIPDLTNKEIEQMRKNVILLARTICEYVWSKKFY